LLRDFANRAEAPQREKGEKVSLGVRWFRGIPLGAWLEEIARSGAWTSEKR
jgi:hypothetical protein